MMHPRLESSVALAVKHRQTSKSFLYNCLHVRPPLNPISLTELEFTSPPNQQIPVSSRFPSDVTACLDCGNDDKYKVNRADIVHGVFLCTPCAELHKSILPGPHRSKEPQLDWTATNLLFSISHAPGETLNLPGEIHGHLKISKDFAALEIFVFNSTTSLPLHP